ncbi:Inner membrane transport protein YdhP [Pseudomonas reidholzensis]|uniref:Inner membrane transport protein YdhP n=1 Tax=Pseudomonas reidholzensis TaxID=1785162 RepID=A0A383RV76_9PSED|nr:MFS transporter [Pseudomonas reidholzensis]SYX90341.1 Inner membrane transport protein YdhP [Pseudomonas reidholzensis]
MQTCSPTAPAVAASAPRTGLAILLFAVGGFALLTTEFIILGLLPGLSRDLGLSVAAAGQLVTLFAVTVMLCGPFLTAWLSSFERKKLFIAIVLVFAASNALAAMAPNVWVLALARFVAALALPVYWGTASESAGQLAGPGREGWAVAKVYLGITAAFVFGIPLGTLAAGLVGWRGSFWLLAGLCLLVALLMWAWLPKLPAVPAREQGVRQTVILQDRRFVAHVLLSALVFTAMFTAYTYLAEILEQVAAVPAAQVGWWLMGFGVVGMLGNSLAGRIVDRSPLGATVLLLVILAVGMAAVTPAVSNPTLLLGALALWGVAYTALFPVCQVRVMQAGARAQALAGTLNVSAANGGIAVGAALGGLVIELLGTAALGYVASGIAALAVVATLLLMAGDKRQG